MKVFRFILSRLGFGSDGGWSDLIGETEAQLTFFESKSYGGSE